MVEDLEAESFDRKRLCCENVAGMQCGRPWLGKHSIGRKVSLGGGRFRGRVI